MLIRARVVVPVSQPPIENGAVLVSRRRIVAVGSWHDLSKLPHTTVRDLEDQVLLPGLVNAHCHLDYTDMAGQFEPPRRFTDWIKLITSEKSQWSDGDFKVSWGRGARMLERTGTTTVGDVESLPKLLPEVWQSTPLRIYSFLEMTGIRSRRDPRVVLDEAMDHIRRLKRTQCRAWLSPHAPYSTLPKLLSLAARAARRHRWRVTTHVAESDQEFEMFMHGQGDMCDWLSRNERDNSDCGLGSPVQHLERCGALNSSLLAIHANYLAPGDADLLGRRGVHVVHCPRSHAFFRHQAFPFEALTAAGVHISLATDSLASVIKPRRQVIELSLFEEMRAFGGQFSSVSPETILRMVTLNPARALGLAGRAGELSPGAFADMITLSAPRRHVDVHESILHHAGSVNACMVGGDWILPPPE